jgi:hypothetical protein
VPRRSRLSRRLPLPVATQNWVGTARDLFDDLARECLARLPRMPVPWKSHVPPSDLERDLIVGNIGYATNLSRARSVALIYFNLLRRYGHGRLSSAS